MDEQEIKYYEEEDKKIVEAKADSVAQGNILAELVTSPGWKIIKGYADQIMNIKRLKIKPDKIDEQKLHNITYIAGQVEGIEKLFRQINASISQRDKLLKEEVESK